MAKNRQHFIWPKRTQGIVLLLFLPVLIILAILAGFLLKKLAKDMQAYEKTTGKFDFAHYLCDRLNLVSKNSNKKPVEEFNPAQIFANLKEQIHKFWENTEISINNLKNKLFKKNNSDKKSSSWIIITPSDRSLGGTAW